MIEFEGMRLETHPAVWTPSAFARQFIQLLEGMDLEGKRVLDFGSGSGAIAIYCARRGATCVGSDINPHAIELGRRNAALNQVAVDFVESDRFVHLAGHEQRFDLIVANTPSSPGSHASERLRANAVDYNENGDGREILDAAIQDGRRFVSAGGQLLSCTNSEQGFSNSDRLLEKYWAKSVALATVEFDLDTPGLQRFADQWLAENRIRQINGRYVHDVTFFLATA